MNTQETIRLTQTVQKGGCAAKVAASHLRQILKQVTFPPRSKQVLVDGAYMDDAAIVQVSEDQALVQTLDFFTPIVDSPRTFGAIAAANALSDVYAMGGTPLTAMAILAFPLATLSDDVIVEVLQGASDKILESGAQFVGGHSIDDDTLKFGLSVTGTVHPKKIWSNQEAQAGDVLILTKAIGTGTLTAGLKRSEWTENEIQDALNSMAQLNSTLDLLNENQITNIHAATDITGFGLLGHALHIAQGSGKSLTLNFKEIPLFEKTRQSLEKGFLTKAHRTNSEYVLPHVDLGNLSNLEKQCLFDPQTSGGLLLSVTKSEASNILRCLQTRFSHAQIIGEVTAAASKSIIVQ